MFSTYTCVPSEVLRDGIFIVGMNVFIDFNISPLSAIFQCRQGFLCVCSISMKNGTKLDLRNANKSTDLEF